MSNSIALIVLDSLRADGFSDWFEWLEGKRFTNAYSTSHWTIPAHASLFIGKYPSEVGVHGKSPTLDCPNPTIQEQLADSGYKTDFYSANTTITNFDGWRRGFDKVIEFSKLDPRNENLVDWSHFARSNNDAGLVKILKAVHHGIQADCPTISAIRQGINYWQRSRADGGTKNVIRRIKKEDTEKADRFLVINLMETHIPYHPPDQNDPIDVSIGDAFAYSISNPLRIREGYEESTKYLSQHYKELYNLLRSNFDVVITVSDHGEMLGEDGMWNHGYGLYPELTKIPIVVSGEGIDDGVHDGIVSLLDVHKTIADMAGIGVESRGSNLLDNPPPKPVMTEYQGFLPWHRDLFERKGVKEDVFEKYDPPLRGLALPEGYAYETHSEGFCTGKGVEPKDARRKLDALRESVVEREVEGFDTELDEETRQQLRNLGYA